LFEYIEPKPAVELPKPMKARKRDKKGFWD
jgi:hypothetical protein